MIRHPRRSPLFPYTTLFRSGGTCRSTRCSATSTTTARASRSATSTATGTRTSCSSTSAGPPALRSEEHTSELQSHVNLVCRLLLEKKKTTQHTHHHYT